ncbi:hypothetical protein B1R94_06380 [Mycolicibacterium litorale]|nr:hypothetical protein B1R94_06380 [Mycolicibacterium litorale]
MARTVPSAESRLTRWAQGGAASVLLLAAVNLVVTASRAGGFSSWAAPWAALWLAGLATAVLLQAGEPSSRRTRWGRLAATVVGVLAAAMLIEHLMGRHSGPTLRTATSVLYLAGATALMRANRLRTGWLWGLLLLAAVAAPLVTLVGHAFRATSVAQMTETTGLGLPTAAGVLVLTAATVVARPDRNPVAWLLARSDRWALLRLVGVLCGLPFLVSVTRLPFLALGLGNQASWILATICATVIIGVITFYASQREQRLLIERAEAERRYRMLADNAVDVVVHLHGSVVSWVSPSVTAAFGDPPAQWIGSDLTAHIHPDDLSTLAPIFDIDCRTSVLARFRVRTAAGKYHWVDGNAKPYLDADGNTDGMIAALRIVDGQVAAEERLDRLARIDTLTGLLNRAETLARLDSALAAPRSPGSQLGILFCDVDHFKTINDTLGHSVGDAVLSTLAARISDSVRTGDTVGRMGGDEIVVLLPGVPSVEEVIAIAEKIRCRAAEPIQYDGQTICATLSIGVTVSMPGEGATAVTARADVAMYQAKQACRNTVVRV